MAWPGTGFASWIYLLATSSSAGLCSILFPSTCCCPPVFQILKGHKSDDSRNNTVEVQFSKPMLSSSYLWASHQNQKTWEKYVYHCYFGKDNRGDVLYSTLLHLPPFRFNCVGGCWDRTQDCSFGIGSQTL